MKGSRPGTTLASPPGEEGEALARSLSRGQRVIPAERCEGGGPEVPEENLLGSREKIEVSLDGQVPASSK